MKIAYILFDEITLLDLIGAAGFLKNKTATTNFNEYKSLEKYCKRVAQARIVDDYNTILLER